MDYFIRIRRPATAKAQQQHLPYVHYHLAYLRDLPDLRGDSKRRIKQVIRDHLNDGLALRPDVTLKQTEHVVVIPNPRIGVQERRATKAIYNAEMELPAAVVDTHNTSTDQHGGRSQ